MAASPHRRARRLLLIAFVAAVGGGLGSWFAWPPSSVEPRDPDREVPAKVGPGARLSQFVGHEKCAECHASIAEQYATTGHASTFAATADIPAAQALGGVVFRDPIRDIVYHYHFDPQAGLSVSIPGLFGDSRFPLSWAVGSNQHGITFLTLHTHRGQTGGIEHRVAIYGESGRLDLAPEHREDPRMPKQKLEFAGRLRKPSDLERCVGCHTTHFEIVDQQLQSLLPNVQCESCHGPGARHVDNMSLGLEELAIDALRGDRPESALAQIERCGQCHRLPLDVAPRDIRPDNARLARFQPIGLLNSACYRESGGRLSCATCHDPHSRPEEQRAAAVRACLSCHAEDRTESAVCTVSPTSGCIECHMPPVAALEESTFHDHWIRVHTEAVAGSDASP
jgi:hypothetical protein